MTQDGRTRKQQTKPVPSEILDRQPPCDISAEMAVVGSMIKGTDFGELILGDIKGEDFHDNANRLIFEAIVSLLEQSRPIDAGILVDRLKARGSLERCGGIPYLTKCLTSVGPGYNIVHYARIVSKHALRRRSIDAAMKVLQYCYDDQASGEPEEAVIASTVEEMFDDALELRRIESKHASEVFPRVGEQIKQRMSGTFKANNAIKTGLRAVDELTGGLFPQELVVLAARASMGKSSIASQIAANLSFAATPVLYVTLEMSDEELAMRQICSWSGVNLHTVRTNKASHADAWVVESVAGDLATCNLTFMDKPGITPREIIAVAKHIKRKTSGPICVIIDYIGLVELGNGKRNELIGKFVEQMKTLARRLDSPVVLLSQLNRATESDKEKRPKMSNLKESSAVEDHADVVMLLHRQEYYEPKNPDVKGLAELIIAKNRNGPVGTASLLWSKHTLSFKDVDVDNSEADDLQAQAEWDKEQGELPF